MGYRRAASGSVIAMAQIRGWKGNNPFNLEIMIRSKLTQKVGIILYV